MSNVLIGIIGVILFIGLALAGSVILGEDFMTARSSSKATVLTSQMQQLSMGISTLAYRRGIIIPSNSRTDFAQQLVDHGAIKSIPQNPINNSPYYPADETGNYSSRPIRIIWTPMGSDEEAREICHEIEEQAGSEDPNASIETPMYMGYKYRAQPLLGCFMNRSRSNEYTAYIGV